MDLNSSPGKYKLSVRLTRFQVLPGAHRLVPNLRSITNPLPVGVTGRSLIKSTSPHQQVIQRDGLHCFMWTVYYLAWNQYKTFKNVILVSFKIVLIYVIFEMYNKYQKIEKIGPQIRKLQKNTCLPMQISVVYI